MNKSASVHEVITQRVPQAADPAELLRLIEKAERPPVSKDNVRDVLRPEIVNAIKGSRGGFEDHALAVMENSAFALLMRNELFKQAAVLRSRDPNLPAVPDPSTDHRADLSIRLRQWATDAMRVWKISATNSLIAANHTLPREEKPAKRDPAIQRLFDALNGVVWRSEYVTHLHGELVDLYATMGKPRDDDWPEMATMRCQKIEAWVLAHPNEAAGHQDELRELREYQSEWLDTLLEWKKLYLDWVDALDEAIDAVPATRPILDAGEMRPAEKWTAKLLLELRELKAHLYPHVGGLDGMGVVRLGCRPLPPRFRELAAAVYARQMLLFDLTVDSQDARIEEGVATSKEDEAIDPKAVEVSWELMANKARELLKAKPEFRDKSIKEWKAELGCSIGLIAKLPAWRAIQAERKAAKRRYPKVVSLTKPLEATLDDLGQTRGRAPKSGKPSRTPVSDLTDDGVLEELLLEAVGLEGEAHIRSMTPESRRQLLQTTREQDDDDTFKVRPQV